MTLLYSSTAKAAGPQKDCDATEMADRKPHKRARFSLAPDKGAGSPDLWLRPKKQQLARVAALRTAAGSSSVGCSQLLQRQFRRTSPGRRFQDGGIRQSLFELAVLDDLRPRAPVGKIRRLPSCAAVLLSVRRDGGVGTITLLTDGRKFTAHRGDSFSTFCARQASL